MTAGPVFRGRYEPAIPRLRRSATMSLMNGASNRVAHGRRRQACLGWVAAIAVVGLVACSGGGGGTATAIPDTAPTTSDTVAASTTTAPTSTSTTTTTVRPAGPCTNVGFSPNSDNAAGGIVANGLTCAEAEALVRKVGLQVRSIGGPSRVEVDGFACERTAQSDLHMPTSTFTCTSGTKSVTFVRT